MQKKLTSAFLQKEERKYEIILENRAKKSFRRIPFLWRNRIRKVIDTMETTPFIGEKLLGDFSGCYKIKVWPYRIIFEILEKEKEVHIHKIEHRQGVYKR